MSGVQGRAPVVGIVKAASPPSDSLEEKLHKLLIGRVIDRVTITDEALTLHLDNGESLQLEWPGGVREVA